MAPHTNTYIKHWNNQGTTYFHIPIQLPQYLTITGKMKWNEMKCWVLGQLLCCRYGPELSWTPHVSDSSLELYLRTRKLQASRGESSVYCKHFENIDLVIMSLILKYKQQAIKLFLYNCSHHHRAASRFAPSQWETSLQSNAVSHCLGANLESALHHITDNNDLLWHGDWSVITQYCIQGSGLFID